LLQMGWGHGSCCVQMWVSHTSKLLLHLLL
jgi:hypothetical protein